MKNTACLAAFLLFLVSSVPAQFVSPVPVIETEVRDNSSIKIRSIELDRVKRESRRKNPEKPGKASVNNFLEIKEDFEKIQNLQSAIVAVYTTEKQINYAKIAALSAELNLSALRLRVNLFPSQDKEKILPDDASTNKQIQEIKNLIVELDNAIGAFVGSPMFSNAKKADLEVREKTESGIRRVIELSDVLKREAEKNAPKK